MEVSKSTPAYAYQSDITWINQRIDRIEKKCKFIIAIMADKKIITPELAKAIFETKTEEQLSLIELYLKEMKIK
jgi:hypothetical protein